MIAGAVHIGTTGGADVGVRELPPQGAELGAAREDTVLLAADGLSSQALGAAIGEAHKARAGLVVALPAHDVESAARAALAAGAYGSELEVFEPSRCLADARLADAVVKAAGDRATALARSLAWLRHATVARVIRRTALENAAVGALVVVPGADMPIMTVNQVRMVLRIAVAYGQEIEAHRAPEVLAVVGAGLGLRAVAHQGLKLLPAAGWALKGGIGYAGTLALGRAAVAYHESGATGKLGGARVELPRSVQRRLPGPLAGRLSRRLGRGGAAAEPLAAYAAAPSAPVPETPPPHAERAQAPEIGWVPDSNVSIEAPGEPRERNSSHVVSAEGGLSGGR
jgi:uncharacterized protein (DUF697 family)